MNASMKPLRVGLIGAGWASRYHLRGWERQSGRAEVVALADPNAEVRAVRAAEFSIPEIFDSAESLIAATKPDVLDICTPRETHADLVRLAADRGLATICQKPFAPSLAEARRVVADVGGRVPVMVHENWRFRSYYRRIAELLCDGACGDIRQVQFEFLSSGMIPDAHGARQALVRQPFLRTLDRMLVMEIVIHHIDTLRFLLGELDFVSAWLARTNDEIIGEDVASILLKRREGGAPVSITASLAVHGAPPLPQDHLRIFGSAGTIELDGTALAVCGRCEVSETFDADAAYQGAYDASIGHFIDRLADGKLFETRPDDNLKTLEIVEAIYAGAERS
ncbi:MAG: Gfo/Idh/MocA family oxidoreductase [Bauldia sp.]